MVQLQNFFFFITSMVVASGTAAPVLLKWFVSRDVPTGAPSSNGTIIPIPIPEFLFLVYLHSRKFIRSMDRAKSGVLVRASRPILLPDIIGRSSSARNALFRFVPFFHFLLIESMGDLSYLESFCGLLCLQIFRTLFNRGIESLRSTNTNKIEFTQRLPLGPELHMGKERCCLRGLDHLHGPTSHSICGNLMIYKSSPTSDRFMFEHDESLRADLLPINFPPSYENGKLEHFLHRWMKNHEHKNFWFTMFPEKRYFFSIRERTSTTEVAIHTNPFTDLICSDWNWKFQNWRLVYHHNEIAFYFSIRIGFLLASSGGSRSLLRQLQKDKLHWNRESSVPFIIA
uniref:Cytochrome c biogenesis FC n=1 Tax=Phoenix dactylifera TaxID=42345 RepID=A0A2R4FZF3_PHODC|nr:cytochrome c biogenesis FC [Phoenix dactylifera]